MASAQTVIRAGSLTRTFSVLSGSRRSQRAQPSSISTSPQRVTWGDPQEGGDDGSCLGRLGVRGVAAADEQVVSAELFRGLCQRIARSQRVRAAESAVREQRRLVAAHGQRLFEHLVRLGRPHAHGRHRAAVLFLETQRRLQGVGVKRVHYALHALALQIAGLGVKLHVLRIRHLFYKNYNFHLISLSAPLFLRKDGAADEHAQYLVRALAYLQQLCVAHEAFDVVLLAVAVAA